MNTVEIIVLVNAQQLAAQVADKSLSSGTSDAPTSLGSWATSNVYLSMVAQAGSVSNTSNGTQQGQSELAVTANSGDTLTWTMTTLDNNSDYTAFIYKSYFTPEGYISTDKIYSNSQAYEYLPPSGKPLGPLTGYTNHIYSVTAQVEETGAQVQYTLSFVLVNNATGQVVGYFSWDPFINITGPVQPGKASR